MSKVTVTSKEGQVVIPSANNAEFGYMRVESITPVMENGWLKNEKRSALIRGKVADLNSLNYKSGQVLPGKIIVTETTVSPYADAKAKVNPSTGEILKDASGKAIYRDAFYTEDMSKHDTLIAHATVVAAQVTAQTV